MVMNDVMKVMLISPLRCWLDVP